LHLNSGATLQADAKAREPYASFNRAADKIERRVRRYRKRLSDHHAAEDVSVAPAALKQSGGKAGSKFSEPVDALEDSSDDFPPLRPWPGEDGSLNPAVIAEPASAFKRMTVSKAVMELDLTNAPVLVFRHDSDGRTNIVYRRADGNIGWIDPGRP
jgi:hypothetical protein